MHLLTLPGNQCGHQLASAALLFHGLTDAHRALEPVPGLKTAGWVLGHLAVTGDFARKVCGRPAICPKEWRAMFNPGTQPSHDAAQYPPMADLIETLQRVYADLRDAATQLDDDALSAPNPFPPSGRHLKNAGEFVGYLLTGHLGYHLGQLQAWRAAAGVPRETL